MFGKFAVEQECEKNIHRSVVVHAKVKCVLCAHCHCRIENGKMFEEIVLDKVIAEEREWRSKTEIDVQMGIARDEKTQLVLAAR